MRLWLVRHARPQAEPGLCYGRTNLPADPQATFEAAQALAAALPRHLPLISSPLQRCERLSEATSGLRPDLTLKTEPRLAEMDFGDWEGRPWDRLPLDAWMADFWAHRPGNGESVQSFMGRVAAVFDAALLQKQEVAWITHAGVIRAVQLLHAGTRVVDSASQWPADAITFGSWRVLDV
jgi:alpha-ribazole phosphatase